MPHILVIDDDPTLRMTLARALRKQGFEVSVASNGAEGLAVAEKLEPGLIICDWMMPCMDGLEVCRHVKANPRLANTYFILLTSRGQVGDIVEGLESGADDFLAKPPDLNELRARVRAGLRLHQANRQLQLQKQYLEEELRQAAEYVRSLLPPDLDGDVVLRAYFLPSAQLGGDCFDCYWLDRDRLVVYLLDVAGHGVGAALLSVSILNLLRAGGLHADGPMLESVDFGKPAEMLRALNTAFQMTDHRDMYFTMWYGIFDRRTRQLAYASAGHPPAVLIDRQNDEAPRVQKLRTSGLPVGMLPDTEFESVTCTVPSGSTLYLFSDGMYEVGQHNGHCAWGMEEFVEALVSAYQYDAAHGAIAVVETVKQVAGKHLERLEDDMSLLQVHFP